MRVCRRGYRARLGQSSPSSDHGGATEHSHIRRAPALIPLAITLGGALALAGCGSGGPGKLHSGVAAEVGNAAISEAELNHLISVEATIAKQSSGTTVTKPVVLDAPSFSRCIAEEEASRQAAEQAVAHGKSKPATQPTPLETKSQLTLCKSEYEKFKEPELTHLIYQDWIIGEATQKGLKVTAAEIQHAVDELKSQIAKQSKVQKLYETAGVTSADLSRKVTIQLLQGKLGQKISSQIMAKANAQGVTHAQLAAYYKENLRKYEHPETRNVQLILTESLGAALKAKREITSGKSFASVEKRVSKYPSEQVKKDGGSLPEATIRKQFETVKHSTPGASTPNDEKIYEEAIFSAKEHVLTGPVKTSEAYFLFQVNKINKGQPTETLAQIESSIKSTLIYHHGESMFANFDKELEKRWKARTNCAKSFVVSYCEQYVPHKEMALAEQARQHGKEAEEMKKQEEHEVRLNSTAIVKPSILAQENGAKTQFATRYTCYGANVSPPFSWGNLPPSTAEILITLEQLTNRGDRSNVWVVGGINPSTHSISAGSLPPGAIVGHNTAGKAAWGGICPPKGAEYEYSVALIPLRAKLGLKPGFDLKSLSGAIEKNRLGIGSIAASYKHS